MILYLTLIIVVTTEFGFFGDNSGGICRFCGSDGEMDRWIDGATVQSSTFVF